MTWALIFWHKMWNCWPERYGKFQSEIPSTSGVICEKPQGGPLPPSVGRVKPAGRCPTEAVEVVGPCSIGRRTDTRPKWPELCNPAVVAGVRMLSNWALRQWRSAPEQWHRDNLKMGETRWNQKIVIFEDQWEMGRKRRERWLNVIRAWYMVHTKRNCCIWLEYVHCEILLPTIVRFGRLSL